MHADTHACFSSLAHIFLVSNQQGGYSMQSIHYFAGANTARGFVSCFEDILPQSQQKRMYYIKGGPGVGKSTLMKRFAAAAQARGLETESFHCSSDPDSLDGVALPALGVGMMDATAPHVYDPVVPGARDTLVSLGDFLDEGALHPHAGEIAAIQKQISARFARCYRYLAASEQVLCAAPPPAENPVKLRELSRELAKQLPLRDGNGSVRRLYASAFTPKGRMNLTDFAAFERRVTIDCPFGAHATGLMENITRLAVERGLHVIQLLDPLMPNRIAHVVIPAHGLAFCTGQRTAAAEGEWLDAQELFDETQADREQSFEGNACELLWQRALEQLSAAKQLHDELERFYVGNMDFERWQKVLDTLISRLG